MPKFTKSKSRIAAEARNQPCKVRWYVHQSGYEQMRTSKHANVPAGVAAANALRRKGISALVYTLDDRGNSSGYVDETCLSPVLKAVRS
jgi:hypothetical protein